MENVKLNKPEKTTKQKVLNILRNILAIFITLVMLFPLYWMLISSFKSSEELLRLVPTLWPREFRWNNYSDALKMAPFGLYFYNTIVMTLGIMFLQLTIGIFAAYGFAKGQFWGRDALFVLVLGALMVPIQITFVPTYVMISKLQWINTFKALIIPNAVSAYFIFMLRQSFKSIDDSYVEAARVDGMGRIGIIFKILVPMNKPTIFTVSVITFINGWNSYFWPKVVTTRPEMRTIAIGVYELKRSYAGLEIMNVNQIMAGAVMATVPVIIVFLLMQKYLLEGFSTTTMK